MPDYFGSAFHAEDGSVHHIEERCPDGLQVPQAERVAGTGGLPMCEWCRIESERRRAPPRRYFGSGR
jgi:hypothetical protein